jgi:hypothetical protein
MAGAAAKEPVDLAIIMGGPKGKKSEGEPMAREEDDESEGDELPAGFEEAFSEAFPEAAGDTERMQALKRLIHICSGSY